MGESSPSTWSLDFCQAVNIRDVYDLPVKQRRITHRQSGSIQLMFPRLNATCRPNPIANFMVNLFCHYSFQCLGHAGFELPGINCGAICKEKAG